jgi:hypothetical protein
VTVGLDKCADALARCNQLTRLTCADRYPPSAWLGLSQLHTLQGVSFYSVSVAAIAAALPRLHTLHASGGRWGDSAAVAGFYDDLLPRLQSFHFAGWWPEKSGAPALSPLPLLHDLNWKGSVDDEENWIEEPRALPNEFYGAQPESLHATLFSIAERLTEVEAADGHESGADRFLARVRDLWIGLETFEVSNSDFARLLHAAPQLRRLTVEFNREQEKIDGAEGEDEDSAILEVVHTRLRHLVVICHDEGGSSEEVADCAVKLQHLYFPRLRRLTVDNEDYAVSATR